MATKKNNSDEAVKTVSPEQTQAPPELLEINELKKKHKVGAAVFAGVCTANNWKPGKRITDSDFKEAVDAFLAAPADGKEVKRQCSET